MHISNFLGLNIDGHKDIDFVDVNLKTDTKLFIDPFLIESVQNSFSKECTAVINSFFNCIFACKDNDRNKLATLLSFGHEPNETKLGLSRNQSSGKGASSRILYDIFKQVWNRNLISQGLVQKPNDLCLFIENFAEDRMSDLITNILRRKLYEFTKVQCNNHDITLDNTKIVLGRYWDPDKLSWEKLEDYPLKVEGLPVILVPKIFVCQRYIYSVGEYLQHKILVERQKYHRDHETSLAILKQDKSGNSYYDKPPKKTVYDAEVKGTHHKKYAEEYSRNHLKDLSEFRKNMTQKSLLSDIRLTNEELDIIVYKFLSKIS